MIDDLDRTLERLLREKTPLPSPDYNVSFEVPTEAWATKQNVATVNVYLHDIRENHDFRVHDWHDELQPDGTFVRRRPLVRLDCFYVVTTWSGDDDPLGEHRLLALVLQTLLRYPSLPPEVLQGALVAQEPPLPYLVAQLEGLPQPPAEFWSALGNKLRPSINVVVTIALQPRAVTDVPERLRPVISETLLVGVRSGALVEANVTPPLRDARTAGAPVRAVALAQASSGKVAAPVFAAPDVITVADGRSIEANALLLLDDAARSEVVRVGPKPASGPAPIALARPLRFDHAAATPIRPVDVAFATAGALESDAAAGVASLQLTDGNNVPVGWALIDDGDATEAVELTTAGTPGPSTVQLARALQFAHEAGRTLRLATLRTAVTQLRDPANLPEQSVTLAAPPPPALTAGTPIRIGRGDSAEFGTVAGTAGAVVNLAARLWRNHAAGAAVRALTDGDAVGRLARPAVAGDAQIGIAADDPGSLERGDVVKLEGAATSYHELGAAQTLVGVIREPAEEFDAIGGRVTDDGSPPEPVIGATVLVVDRGLTGRTDDLGRFRFAELEAGSYTLRVAALGFVQRDKQVQVPATRLDEYEVALSPN